MRGPNPPADDVILPKEVLLMFNEGAENTS